jgi:hypothetical protein
MMAAMPTSGHRRSSPPGSTEPTAAPTTPPMMSSGASTPPEVPDPSDVAQMKHFTATSGSMSVRT